MTPETMYAFADELLKLGGVQAPTESEQPGLPSRMYASAKRNVGPTGVIGGGLALGLAAKNPAAAAKYLRFGKELVTKPGRSLARGWRSGRLDIKPGMAGASDAASKRVGLYKNTFKDALEEGTLLQHDALTGDPGFLRRQNILSAGARRARGLELSPDLKARVAKTQKALADGAQIPESQLRALYDEIGQAGAGLKTKAGLGTYMPGERALTMGMGGGFGASEGLSETDENGRKRGMGERVARGATGALLGVGTGHMLMGRGTGLSAKTLSGKKGFLSQKGLLPLAASGAIMGGVGMATDAAGAGGQLVDRSFGQGE